MRTRMLAAVVAVLALVSLAAQSLGDLSGTITDTVGGPLPGVKVTLSGPDRRDAVTNDRGEFTFTQLPAGAYRVLAELPGFVTVLTHVAVTAGRPAQLSLEMKVGTLEETITITGETPVLDSQSSRMQQTVSKDVLAATPSSRNAGGVTGGAAGGLWAPAAAAPTDVSAGRYSGPFNTEAYDHIDDNAFRRVTSDPLSTFSIDVDTASYANVRRFLSDGTLPPAGAVRIEELINYFRFDYPQPTGDAPFSVTTELTACPWDPKHQLVLVGIQGRELAEKEPAPRNLVFLLDVSGSMQPPDKLPLVRSAMRMLVDILTPRDRVAIVVYAGASGLVLPSTSGDRKEEIHHAIARLDAGGSTNGAAGIRLAYQIARQNMIRDGVNRVVLATDGDFNVGVTSQDELVRLIERERADGIFLSVLGVGTGNLKDSTMEKLADKGNGNYAYLDSLHEARKVLVREAGATLTTIAKDVKIQIEFNPKAIAGYRLIGYENRVLRNEDFNDDRKDAGEIGAGHSVTALYEIVPAGQDVDAPDVDPLRYQMRADLPRAADAAELATVKVRFKARDGDTSRLMSMAVRNRVRGMSPNVGFASAVAEFGMLLRDSRHRGQASYESVLKRARMFRGADPDGYRAEFARLVDLAAGLRPVVARTE